MICCLRRAFAPCAAGIIALAAAQAHAAIVQEQASYVPQDTVIAILPVVNGSGEKDARQRRDQAARGSEELARLFAERGFRLVPAPAVEQALSEANADLEDEEQQNRATLLRVGKAAGADLVAFATILNVEPGPHKSSFKGRALIKLWLLDVGRETAVFSARKMEGHSRGGLDLADRHSEYIRRAVALAVQNALREFLSAYPRAAKR